MEGYSKSFFVFRRREAWSPSDPESLALIRLVAALLTVRNCYNLMWHPCGILLALILGNTRVSHTCDAS